jgi:secreted trypsin-like serine protease
LIKSPLSLFTPGSELFLKFKLLHLFFFYPDYYNCECKDPSRIIGGTVAVPHSVPFQVGITSAPTGRTPYCGGSLISPNYVLTAAHCTVNQIASTFWIIVGDHNFQVTGDGEQYYLVSKKLEHPSYNSPKSEAFDYSLLKLSTPVPLPSATAGLVCIPSDTTQTFAGVSLKISGWGYTKAGGTQSPELMVATITGLSNTVCQSKYPQETIGSYQLCATFTNTDTCQGDSGGIFLNSLF